MKDALGQLLLKLKSSVEKRDDFTCHVKKRRLGRNSRNESMSLVAPFLLVSDARFLWWNFSSFAFPLKVLSSKKRRKLFSLLIFPSLSLPSTCSCQFLSFFYSRVLSLIVCRWLEHTRNQYSTWSVEIGREGVVIPKDSQTKETPLRESSLTGLSSSFFIFRGSCSFSCKLHNLRSLLLCSCLENMLLLVPFLMLMVWDDYYIFFTMTIVFSLRENKRGGHIGSSERRVKMKSALFWDEEASKKDLCLIEDRVCVCDVQSNKTVRCCDGECVHEVRLLSSFLPLGSLYPLSFFHRLSFVSLLKCTKGTVSKEEK